MRLAITSLLVFLATTSLHAQELWHIGAFDHSFAEFALARNFRAFSQTFPHDVTFRVGVSDPKRDWPFVEPGPADAWAGSRSHPFTIEFALSAAPTTPLRLRIALVDVQAQVITSMVLKVGDATGTFHLRNGHGDQSLYDPAQGLHQEVSAQLPAALFHAGLNRLTITSTGSWFTYDALSLTAEPATTKPRIRSLTVEPTVLLRRLDTHTLGQVVIARMEIEGPAKVPTITASVPGAKIPAPQALPVFGSLEQEVLLPEVKSPTEVTITAALAGSHISAVAHLAPVRHWRIYIAPSTHTDIGYTDLQANIVARHNENTDRAIALCAKYPAFDWNLETAFLADEYARLRTPAQCKKLYALARAGRIGVQANYANMLTGLCSSEELDRWLYYAAYLKRVHGVPMESALTSDVPTQTWAVPSTLAAAGIHYYAAGINTTRGYGFTKLMSGFPYWWEGPDGSRVLTYFAPGYGEAGPVLRTFQDLRTWVLATTRNRAKFPYDALFLYGAFPDNGLLDENIAPVAQRWADTYVFPKVILCPEADYFKYMEAKYGSKLPVVRGGGGAYWEDGAASSASETAANREAHETASAADALWAAVQWTGKTAAPKAKLHETWRDILLYDEHTWGAYNSISDPGSKFVTEQWAVKKRFALDADHDSWQLMEQGLKSLLPLVRTKGPALLVFNPTSWPREGQVSVASVPGGMVPTDPETGRPLASAGNHFRLPRVPAWGYVACPLVKGDVTAKPKPVEMHLGPATIENEYLRLTIDPATGGIASLIDKTTGRELVDKSAPYKLNEYLYVSGGDGTNIVDLGAHKPADLTIHRPLATHLWRTVYPGLGECLTVGGEAEKSPQLIAGYTLWRGCPRLDIFDYVLRTPERKKEAAYFAFPFAATDPHWRLELPNAVMRPELDQLPGACKEWYAIQHFARLTSKGGSLAFASPDAPLVCLGDINRGRWPDKLVLHNGWLFSYVMNNYWFTNYKADQDGPEVFDYSITAGPTTDAQAARFGWQASMPLRCQVIHGAQEGPLLSSGSICRVSPAGVLITAIKTPEAGRGIIVRLLSMEPRPVVAKLTVGLPGITSATLCDLVEEPLSKLKLRGRVVDIPVKPLAPTTVLLK